MWRFVGIGKYTVFCGDIPYSVIILGKYKGSGGHITTRRKTAAFVDGDIASVCLIVKIGPYIGRDIDCHELVRIITA